MYTIKYMSSVVKKDIPKIASKNRQSIKNAIEQKLTDHPIEFGKPLQYSLKGLRRLRVGPYRVIFQIEKNIVLIVKIGHRNEIYDS